MECHHFVKPIKWNWIIFCGTPDIISWYTGYHGTAVEKHWHGQKLKNKRQIIELAWPLVAGLGNKSELHSYYTQTDITHTNLYKATFSRISVYILMKKKKIINSPSSPSPPVASWSEPHSHCPQTGRSSGRACCRSEAEGKQRAKSVMMKQHSWDDKPPLCHRPFAWSSAGCSVKSFVSLPHDFWKCLGWLVVGPSLVTLSSWEKKKQMEKNLIVK